MDEKTVTTTTATNVVEPNVVTTGQTEANTQAAKVDFEAEMKRLREENDKLKKAQTAASKDASEWKAKFRDTQDEATRAAEEKQEELNRILEENKQLKQTQALATHKAGWLGLGFTEALASEAANASVNSDFDALLGVMKKFIDTHDKELKAASIRTMPAPVSGSSQGNVTQEQFDGMSYREREKIFNESPELYRKLAGKE